MSFQLPEYDSAFLEFVHTTAHELALVHHPILAEMGHESEQGGSGGGTVVDNRDGERLDMPSGPVRMEMTAEREDLRQSNYEPLLAQLDSAGAERGEQMMKLFIASLESVTESTGNVFDAEGKGFSFDLFQEVLEKLEFTLDENDELVMPSLLMHPDQAKQLENLPEPTPDQVARIDDLKRRKREELLAQRRSRRLS